MIYMKIPSIPISLNNAYFTVMKKQGKKNIPIRVLTNEGKIYKSETSAYISQNYPSELAKFKKNRPYLVYFRLSMKILNDGWPGKAQNRYKRSDVGNRHKLIEDVLAEVTGLDDSQNLVIIAEKRQLEEPEPYTEIIVWDMEKDDCPIRDALSNV